ncbi:MAG: glycosyltransferase family 4 protein, partial [Planctomycetaceae bacterium]
MRIAHFVTHPIQYFAPLYRAIAVSPDVELTVLFGSDFGTTPSYDPGLCQTVKYDVPLLDGFQHEFLTNRGDGKPGPKSRSFDCPGLHEVITKDRFDAVWIHGWGYHAQRQVARACRKAGIPYLLRGESTLLEAPLFRPRWLRRRYLHGRLIRGADICLYVGQENRLFLKSFGVPDRQLFPAHYSVDARFFNSHVVSDNQRLKTRENLGACPDDLVVVTVAKLIRRKRVDDVIKAVALCGRNVKLWVIGDGDQSSDLRALADTMVPENVCWLGFRNQQELPAILSSADVFVLASDEETWGLVVNEAMACGLPVVLSDLACFHDYDHDEEFATFVPPGDAAGFAAALQDLAKSAEQRQSWARASLEVSRNHSFERHVVAIE